MTREFGLLCRGYRFALGLSQIEFARRSGIHNTTISRVEKGNLEVGRKVRDKLFKELNVPPERQAEFLLYAAGHPPERVEELLIQSKQEINITRDLEEGEILEIKITTDGLRLRKYPAPIESA